MADNKQVLAEISQTKKTFNELEDFLLKADENIAKDPDDPRDGIGRFPGLDRLMLIIPCVINRLEEDISKSKDGENTVPITEGLQAITEGVNSVLVYYLRDDVGDAYNLLSNAILKMEKHSSRKLQSGIRFRSDMAGIVPDFQILLDTFEGFRETKRTRPEEPEIDDSWSSERWLNYYVEQARLEEPLFAMVDAEGLSEESLEKGMKQMIEESKQRDRMMERQFVTYQQMKNRDAAFDPEQPEKFLDLTEIPEVKDEDDDDYEVRTVDLRYEEEEEDEESEPWANSLPELQNWNKHKSGPSFDDEGPLIDRFEDDPVYSLLKPFTSKVFDNLKQDYLQKTKESEEDMMRSPLDHYIILLALKPQARISSCSVRVESIGHDAPRKGVYMFTMECLERIADAIEKLPGNHHYTLATEARNIKKQIGKILAEST